MERKVWSMSLGLAIMLLTTGCPTHTQSPQNDSDELVGAPPSRQQDPFASQARPPESARAPTAGMMEVDPSSSSSSSSSVTQDPLPSDRSKTPRPALVKEAMPEQIPKEKIVEAPIPNRPEEVKPDALEPQKKAELHKCFSCVQICPASDRSGDCSQSKEDVICGWGTSKSEPDAQKLARAECDATLDMAREMPRFSRIDGSCPRATCTLD